MPLIPHTFEQELNTALRSPSAIISLKNEGHVVLERESGISVFLMLSEEGSALFIAYPLITIDPVMEQNLMSLALFLNLSPVNTLPAGIGWDREKKQLVLRYTHDISVKNVLPLDQALGKLDDLSSRLILILEQNKGAQETPNNKEATTQASSLQSFTLHSRSNQTDLTREK